MWKHRNIHIPSKSYTKWEKWKVNTSSENNAQVNT